MNRLAGTAESRWIAWSVGHQQTCWRGRLRSP